MKLLSIQCGLPREVPWNGMTVTTSIYKQPVAGRIALRTLNLDGDRQSDLTVHGGTHKAVYCYPSEHYDFWRKELPGRDLPPGAFGENFTTEGLTEDTVHIGDRFAIGAARVIVTQPRLPCYKLGILFHSGEMIKRFLDSRRSGFYLAVESEGDVGAGDEITPLSLNPAAISITEFLRLYLTKQFSATDIRKTQQLLTVESLPDSWAEYFEDKLQRLQSS